MKKSWTIRVPFQPKDSGKFFHGSFNVLGLEFSDRLPGWLNNFLWKVRELPGIHIISVFLARGGVSRCYKCNKFMWPWQTLIQQGNIYDRIGFFMDTHTNCKLSPKSNMFKVQEIEDHLVTTFYQPDWFIKDALDRPWLEIVNRVSGKVKERLVKYPIHELVKDKISPSPARREDDRKVG